MILKDGLSKAFNNNLYAHNILNEMLDEFNSHEYIRNTTVFINALYKNECLQKMNAVKIDIINNEEIIEQFNEKKNGLKDEIKNELDSIELLKEYYKSK